MIANSALPVVEMEWSGDMGLYLFLFFPPALELEDVFQHTVLGIILEADI